MPVGQPVFERERERERESFCYRERERERERERDFARERERVSFLDLFTLKLFFRLVYVSVTIVCELGADRTEVLHSVLAHVARASFSLARVSRVSFSG